ncbi:AI-2E family transporter [Melittangium boletus]|uniref:AI-2E family transporter n=1 Tax=Melittangium boletus DSM 14713 TaxID=1294270 RepID=A0A250IIN9_9BACT|nr:AI-2E family transporter [Melittangium boletus]ATB31689.1 AI-2E family transporter [Melittangium boletus DSM 14713]
MATEKGAQRVFIGLILLSLALVFLVAYPFFEAFFLAAVLAGAFQGLHNWLTRHFRGRRGLASGVICAGIILALLAPITAITAFIVTEITQGVEFVSNVVNQKGLEGLLNYVPGMLRGPAERLMQSLQSGSASVWQTIQSHVSSQGTTAAQTVGGMVMATGTVALQATMMMIALYFLLVDGGRLVGWIEQVSPLRRGQTTELLNEFRTVTKSVLTSSVLTAGVQALAAMVGYFIARVPAPLFFTAVTFVFALIPAIGGAAVCIVAALLLLATGHTGFAIFLAAWGIIVVGLSDNVVKPILAKRGMNMHGALVFFSLLGGLAMFGAIGLLLGPLILAFFLAVVRIYERDYGDRRSTKPLILPEELRTAPTSPAPMPEEPRVKPSERIIHDKAHEDSH